MGMIEMNPDDIRDPFAVAPEGHYVVQCVSAERTTSKAGDAMIKATFQITDGDVDDIEEHIGKNIFENFMLEGGGARFGLFQVKQLCEAHDLDPREAEPVDLINLTWDVDIKVTPPDVEKGYDEGNAIKRIYVD